MEENDHSAENLENSGKVIRLSSMNLNYEEDPVPEKPPEIIPEKNSDPKRKLLILLGAGIILVIFSILLFYLFFRKTSSSKTTTGVENKTNSEAATDLSRDSAASSEDSFSDVSSLEIDYSAKYLLFSDVSADQKAINSAWEIAKNWKPDAKLAFYSPINASSQKPGEHAFKFFADSSSDQMFRIILNGDNQPIEKVEIPKNLIPDEGFIDQTKIKIPSELAYKIGNNFLDTNVKESSEVQLEPASLFLSYKKDSGLHVWTYKAKFSGASDSSQKEIFIDAKTGKISETPFTAAPILPGAKPETTNSNVNSQSPPEEVIDPLPVSDPSSQEISQNNFSFGVMGDTKVFNPNNPKGNYQKAVATMSKENFNFMFVMGDLISSCDGTKKCETKLTQWRDTLGSLKDKTYEVVGNHDRTGGSAADATWQKVFNLPTNGPSGFSELTYSFSHANSHFVVLNSEKPSEHLINSVQRSWLEKDLSDNPKENVFVFFHEPAYQTSQNTKDGLDADPTERDALWSILKKHNVTAVFNGHEHIHTRKKIGSIYQIVQGDTDSTDDDTAGKGLSDYSYKGKSYLIVNVNEKNVNLKLFDLTGKLLNSFDLVK